MMDLFARIKNISNHVIELNRTLNKRNNCIVYDVSQIIHEVLHETNEVSRDLTEIKNGHGHGHGHGEGHGDGGHH